MFALSSISTQYLIVGIAAALVLIAFAVLVLAPALSSFGRLWEKIIATILSVYVLAVLILMGVGMGLVMVYYWDSITEFV